MISDCHNRTKQITPLLHRNISDIALQKRRYYHAKSMLLLRNINAIVHHSERQALTLASLDIVDIGQKYHLINRKKNV